MKSKVKNHFKFYLVVLPSFFAVANLLSYFSPPSDNHLPTISKWGILVCFLACGFFVKGAVAFKGFYRATWFYLAATWAAQIWYKKLFFGPLIFVFLAVSGLVLVFTCIKTAKANLETL